MDYLYHYTSESILNKILETGVLKVSQFEKDNKVRPAAIWFSLNSIWENTATKMVSDGFRNWRITKQEQHEKFGLIRFVLKFKKDEFCSWARYKHLSSLSSHQLQSMEDIGIEQGANPKEWYASFQNISLKKCIGYDKWDGEKWQRVETWIN